MQIVQLPSAQNMTGAGKSSAPDSSGKVGGFDSLLKGILGGKTAAVKTLASKGAGTNNGTEAGDLNTLNGILKKLLTALENNSANLNLDSLQELLSKELTEDEQAFLNNIFNNQSLIDALQNPEAFAAFIEQLTGGALGENPDQLLSLIEDTVQTLGSIISKVSLIDKTVVENTSVQTTRVSADPDILKNQFQTLKDNLETLQSRLLNAFQKQGVFSTVQNENSKTDIGSDAANVTGDGKTAVQNSGVDQSGQGQDSQKSENPLLSLFQKKSSKAGDNKTLSANNLSKANEHLQQLIAKNADQQQIASGLKNSFMGNPGSHAKQSTAIPLIEAFGSESLEQLLAKTDPSVKADIKSISLDELVNQRLKFKPQSHSGGGQNGQESSNNNRNAFEQNMALLTNSEKTSSVDALQSKELVNSTYLVDQITEKMTMGVRNGQSRVNIQLHPPSLGKVQVELTLNNNKLSAMIIAETPHVKAVLESNMDQLRTALQNANIEVESFSVDVGRDGGQFASHLKDQNNQNKKNKGFNMKDGEGGVDEIEVTQAHLASYRIGEGSGGVNLIA